ncbi:MAG: acylneuraminate cytidylyltransferase family protein [Actinobacteria bacterium]|nr:acylneuraminate cytidylyltransferase family protein [Actinomycetota bacterium]
MGIGPLIIICARGGSQGVKGKNIRNLAGRPLITHTIDCAFQWGKAERVVVSTDSEEIAEVARKSGADVPFLRPAELGQSDVPKMSVIRHAVNELERRGASPFEVVIDLDVTAPIRRPIDIDKAYSLFAERSPLTVFSVVPAGRNPYYSMVEEDAQGYVHVSKSLPTAITCRQNAPPVYDMNGSIHIYSREYLMDETHWHVCSERSLPYVMDDVAGIDIDREIDFLFVEFLITSGAFTP